MYIRSKTVKGCQYFQIVRTVRDSGKVRQHVVVALGTTSDPGEALASMKTELRRIKKLRAEHPADFKPSKNGEVMLAAKIAKQDAWIAKLESRIEILAEIIKSGELES